MQVSKNDDLHSQGQEDADWRIVSARFVQVQSHNSFINSLFFVPELFWAKGNLFLICGCKKLLFGTLKDCTYVSGKLMNLQLGQIFSIVLNLTELGKMPLSPQRFQRL
ncbi:hypothetical protein [Ochrobactrum sp. Marseille-Q0166]|uniref:hypothetical protein n=1 Tax=Ochrobactrum sp. Marseille-Q0166 TaxID=2761105 RepID=UPI0016560F15|nr:hypothetical protein [Ochrobactrum sp. Marseille-Q0166]MBC8719835.1 hypothetical protein [Ochrobactrum sp. Marseille-Q0166]